MTHAESVNLYNHNVHLGERAIKAKHYVLAQRYFTEAGKYHEYTLDARVTMAFLMHRLGQNDEAREVFERLYKVYYTHAFLVLQYAAFAFNMQDWDLALSLYEKYIEMKPDNPLAYVDLGNLRMRQGAHGLAKENFETAKRLAPYHWNAYVGVSRAKLLLGDTDGAIQESRDLLAQNNSHQAGVLWLSLSLLNKCVKESTLTYWKEAVWLVMSHHFPPELAKTRATVVEQCWITPIKVGLKIKK